MLAADKDRLVAALKQNALSLRQKELEYYVERYTNITTQASILAGFAFESLVELEISDDMRQELTRIGGAWIENVFYCAASMTMVLALYTVCVSSFATVYGHRLALQGPTGSVERAVAVMMKQRNNIFVTFGLSMLFLIVAAVAMAWIKMNHYAAGSVTGVFGIFLVALLRKHEHLKRMYAIPRDAMVRGDVRLGAGVAAVDIGRLEAGFGAASASYEPPSGSAAAAASSSWCAATVQSVGGVGGAASSTTGASSDTSALLDVPRH